MKAIDLSFFPICNDDHQKLPYRCSWNERELREIFISSEKKRLPYVVQLHIGAQVHSVACGQIRIEYKRLEFKHKTTTPPRRKRKEQSETHLFKWNAMSLQPLVFSIAAVSFE